MLYDPIRQSFKGWLREIGVDTAEVIAGDESRKLERELNKILEEVPELADFFALRRRQRVLDESDDGQVAAGVEEGVQDSFPVGNGTKGERPGPEDAGGEPGEAMVEDQKGTKSATPIGRTTRRGPNITFIEAKDRVELAWVDGDGVAINTGHPAYGKARANARALRLHSLFAIASAVQRFIGTESDTPDFSFVDRMMAAWGKQ